MIGQLSVEYCCTRRQHRFEADTCSNRCRDPDSQSFLVHRAYRQVQAHQGFLEDREVPPLQSAVPCMPSLLVVLAALAYPLVPQVLVVLGCLLLVCHQLLGLRGGQVHQGFREIQRHLEVQVGLEDLAPLSIHFDLAFHLDLEGQLARPDQEGLLARLGTGCIR